MISAASGPKVLLSKLKSRMFMLSPVVELGIDRELTWQDLFSIKVLGQGTNLEAKPQAATGKSRLCGSKDSLLLASLRQESENLR